MVASAKGILWGRVWAIAAVQSAITLMWIVYRAYLGKMLGGWGFSEGFTANLLMFETVLAFGLEPIFGLLSDRQKQFLGSRAPLITLGVILGSAIFVGMPLLALLNGSIRFLLPLVAIAWATAMTMFRAPIYSLLFRSAPTSAELPLAMSILTMTMGIMSALKGNVQTFLVSLGAIPAFLIGSITLLGAATFLRFFMPPWEPPAENIEDAENVEDQPTTATTKPVLLWVGLPQTILMAIALAWGGTILLNSWGKLTTAKIILGLDLGSSLNLLLAIASIPLGLLAIRFGKYPLLAIALGWLVVIFAVLWAAPSGVLGYVMLALVWAIAFGMMKNSTFPYIFSVVPERWGGFGVGVFFGVSGLANMLLPMLFPAKNFTLQGIVGILSLAIATMLALLPLVSAQKLSRDEVQ